MPVNYEQLLQQSQQIYSQVLGGYQAALGQQQAAQQNVMSGYNSLQSSVLGNLAGQGAARSQDIAAAYTQQAGSAMQSLISRGLGNTTVQSAVGRGLTFDEQRAQNALAEQVRAQQAQYQTQLGLAGLSYQGQAIGQNSALMQNQLGYMAGYQGNLMQGAFSGLGRQLSPFEQVMAQQRGGGGIVRGGGGGGGGRVPTYGYGASKTHMNADPYVDLWGGDMFGGGYGGGYGGGGPIIHPGGGGGGGYGLEAGGGVGAGLAAGYGYGDLGGAVAGGAYADPGAYADVATYGEDWSGPAYVDE
jgi:hypothetical protein